MSTGTVGPLVGIQGTGVRVGMSGKLFGPDNLPAVRIHFIDPDFISVYTE